MWAYHSLAINSLGELYTYGENANGQLGLGILQIVMYPQRLERLQTGLRWLAAVTSYGHSFAINLSGELYAWGYNYSSQLGLGDTTYRNVPTRVGEASDWNTIATGWGMDVGRVCSICTYTRHQFFW